MALAGVVITGLFSLLLILVLPRFLPQIFKLVAAQPLFGGLLGGASIAAILWFRWRRRGRRKHRHQSRQ